MRNHTYIEHRVKNSIIDESIYLFKPRSHLSSHIENYIVRKSRNQQQIHRRLILPRAGSDGILHFKGHAFKSPYLVGALNKPRIVMFKGIQESLIIRFTLLGAIKLLGIPLQDIRNITILLEDLFGYSFTRLRERMEGSSWPNRLELLDNYFLDLLDKQHDIEMNSRLHQSLSMIIKCPSVKVEELSKELSISRRQLQRLFKTHIGLNPSEFRRVVRFLNAYHSINQGSDFLNTTYRLEYTDQSHFIKEFKQYTTLSPGAYLSTEKLPSTDYPPLLVYNNGFPVQNPFNLMI